MESSGSPNGSSEKSGVRFSQIPMAVNDGKLMIARHVTYISKLILHPSKVLEVQIKKENINPKAGQYIFISCPEISYLQYHPFTLTSAPEEDYVSVHMRIVGDWTSVSLSFFLSVFLSFFSLHLVLSTLYSLFSPFSPVFLSVYLRPLRTDRKSDDRHSQKLWERTSMTQRKKARKV